MRHGGGIMQLPMAHLMVVPAVHGLIEPRQLQEVAQQLQLHLQPILPLVQAQLVVGLAAAMLGQHRPGQLARLFPVVVHAHLLPRQKYVPHRAMSVVEVPVRPLLQATAALVELLRAAVLWAVGQCQREKRETR